MVTRHTVLMCAERNNKIEISNDRLYFWSKENPDIKLSVDEVVDKMRKDLHCDFECIYDCHATLQNVYRCKECGAVIFVYEDERFDPGLCCPVCGNYTTSFDYWTKEEIDNDIKKQNTLKLFAEELEDRKKRVERVKSKNLYAYQIWRKIIKTKKYQYNFELRCDDYFESKIKGLKFVILKSPISEFTLVKEHCIPLSWSAFKKKRKERKKKNEKI